MNDDDRLGTKKEIRCFCYRKPLLAMFGVDEDGKLYIHIKIWRQNKLYGNMVFRGGEISIQCRECFRWYRVAIRDNQEPRLQQTEAPQELDAVVINTSPLLLEPSPNIE